MPLVFCRSKDFRRLSSSLFFSRLRLSLDGGYFSCRRRCVCLVRDGRGCISESSERYFDSFSCCTSDLVAHRLGLASIGCEMSVLEGYRLGELNFE